MNPGVPHSLDNVEDSGLFWFVCFLFVWLFIWGVLSKKKEKQKSAEQYCGIHEGKDGCSEARWMVTKEGRAMKNDLWGSRTQDSPSPKAAA